MLWLLNAEGLRWAAETLWNQYFIDDASGRRLGPVMLLAGLTIELLLKGLAVGRQKAAPRTHDLLELAEVAGLQLRPPEEELLERLTVFVRWAGRYPVPLERHVEDMMPRTHLGGGAMPLTYMRGDDRQVWSALIARLSEELSATTESGPAG
ncbi:MAG TPA: hypothetical protein VKW76_06840 [Candidatus Binatia bacterium]|nr:hypothetical protein [Candidatus Binatia bacterium]